MFHPGPTVFSFKGLLGERVDIAQSLAVLALILLVLSGFSNFIWVATILAMLLVSIYLHELGHAWACEVQGIPVRRIVLFGGGGFCEHKRSGSRGQLEFITLMGPLVNLALWALASLGAWAIWSAPQSGFDIVGSYLTLFARLNLALFIFNMLPVHPLDGGKLLHLYLTRALARGLAMRIAGAVGLVVAVLWWPALILVYLNFGWLLLFAPPIMYHYHMARGEARI